MGGLGKPASWRSVPVVGRRPVIQLNENCAGNPDNVVPVEPRCIDDTAEAGVASGFHGAVEDEAEVALPGCACPGLEAF